MSFTPPPHPNTRPRQDAVSASDRGARDPLFAYRFATLGEVVADWLAHVEAGCIGGNPPMTEEARAAILANERVLRGEGPLTRG